MIPITTKNLGVNQETGLEEILKVWEVNISSRNELIRVVYEIVTLSPTNVEIKTTGNLEYGRYNSKNEGGSQRFTEFRESPLGQGIIQAINGTLADFPNIYQIEPEPENNEL